MTRRHGCLALLMLLLFVLGGCGKENTESGKADTQNVKKEEPGYSYQTEGIQGKIELMVDADASELENKLGEPKSYFEAASCAFEGMDKIYTYDHFRVETYPDGEKDRIGTILLMDDLTKTAEGIGIGMSKEELEKAYGITYVEEGDFYIYKKGGMSLCFLMQEGKIISIEYRSGKQDVN